MSEGTSEDGVSVLSDEMDVGVFCVVDDDAMYCSRR